MASPEPVRREEIESAAVVTRVAPSFLRFGHFEHFSTPSTRDDLRALADHAINGTLNRTEAEWDRRTALGVVMASANYPDTPRLGDEITGLPKQLTDAHVFHAGTAMKDGKVLTSGGRVLCVTALGETVKFAQQQAYRILDDIKFDGAQYRKDIGYRAIKG